MTGLIFPICVAAFKCTHLPDFTVSLIFFFNSIFFDTERKK